MEVAVFKYGQIQGASCCSLFKPKIPKYRKPFKRNAVVLVSQENVDREEGNIPGALPQIIQSCS